MDTIDSMIENFGYNKSDVEEMELYEYEIKTQKLNTYLKEKKNSTKI